MAHVARECYDKAFCHSCLNKWSLNVGPTSPPPPCPYCESEVVEIVERRMIAVEDNETKMRNAITKVLKFLADGNRSDNQTLNRLITLAEYYDLRGLIAETRAFLCGLLARNLCSSDETLPIKLFVETLDRTRDNL